MTTDRPLTTDYGQVEALARQNGPRVMGYLLRRCPAADAADVWQQVMTIAWQRLDKIPTDDDQALAWLIGTARHCHANLRRSEQRRNQATQRLIETIRTTRNITDPPDDSPVHYALEALSPADREILRLMYWDDLSTDQIATVLRIRPATCRKRLQRARDTLQHHLNQLTSGTAPQSDRTATVATNQS